jgi:hypothetical protein
LRENPLLYQELHWSVKILNLPPEANLYTVDATSMYTSIEPATGLQARRNIFKTYNNLIFPLISQEISSL